MGNEKQAEVNINLEARLNCVKTQDSNVEFPEIMSGKIQIRRSSNARLLAYFSFNPKSVFTKNTAYLIIDYLDQGTGSWFLEYFSAQFDHHEQLHLTKSKTIQLTGSNKIKTTAIDVSDGCWINQLNKSDLRLTVIDDTIDSFEVVNITFQDQRPKNIKTVNLSSNATKVAADKIHTNLIPALAASLVKTLRFNPSESPEVSIIIPVYNKFEYTWDCLNSILEFTFGAYEVILVDNASTDQTKEILSKIENLSYFKLKKNIGFSGACNYGVQKSKAPYLLFLNNDTIVQPGWMESMLGTIKSVPEAGVIGSKLLYPKSNRIQHAGITIDKNFLPTHLYRNRLSWDSQANQSRTVDAVTGACLLTPKSIYLPLAGFDESYINGFEDVDYCFKVSESGFKIIYCHNSVVYHYESITEGRLDQQQEKENQHLFSHRWMSRMMALNKLNPPLGKEILPITFTVTHSLMQKQVGLIRDNHIICIPGQHGNGHCLYGPNVKVKSKFKAQVKFDFTINNIEPDAENLVSIDVYDSAGDTLIRHKIITQFNLHELSDNATLAFNAEPAQTLEFRVFWHGTCLLQMNSIEFLATPSPVEETGK